MRRHPHRYSMIIEFTQDAQVGVTQYKAGDRIELPKHRAMVYVERQQAMVAITLRKKRKRKPKEQSATPEQH